MHNPRLVNQETDSSDDSSCEDDEDCSLDSGEEVDEEDFYRCVFFLCGEVLYVAVTSGKKFSSRRSYLSAVTKNTSTL